jgi:hypothetical protein
LCQGLLFLSVEVGESETSPSKEDKKFQNTKRSGKYLLFLLFESGKVKAHWR